MNLRTVYRRAARGRMSLGQGVLACGVALALWHGGYFSPARVVFAVLAVVGIPALLGRRPPRDPVFVGLAVMAAANAGSAAYWHRSDTVAAAAAAAALPVMYAIALRATGAALAAAIAAVASAAACVGIAALVLHHEPAAERIAGIWRAGGTFEYPPALAVACVCGLACVLGLVGARELSPITAGATVLLLLTAIALSYDRAGAVLAVVVVMLYALRLRERRRVVGVGVAAVLVAAVVAVTVARPSGAALDRHLRHGPIAARSDIWSDAWRGVRRRPTLGFGPGGFRRIYSGASASDATRAGRAHDVVLDQAVEAGVVAAAGAVVLLVAGLVRAARGLADDDPLVVAWACAAGAVLLSSLYDFTWSFPPLALVAGIALARLRVE